MSQPLRLARAVAAAASPLVDEYHVVVTCGRLPRMLEHVTATGRIISLSHSADALNIQRLYLQVETRESGQFTHFPASNALTAEDITSEERCLLASRQPFAQVVTTFLVSAPAFRHLGALHLSGVYFMPHTFVLFAGAVDCFHGRLRGVFVDCFVSPTTVARLIAFESVSFRMNRPPLHSAGEVTRSTAFWSSVFDPECLISLTVLGRAATRLEPSNNMLFMLGVLPTLETLHVDDAMMLIFPDARVLYPAVRELRIYGLPRTSRAGRNTFNARFEQARFPALEVAYAERGLDIDAPTRLGN